MIVILCTIQWQIETINWLNVMIIVNSRMMVQYMDKVCSVL